MIMAWLAARLVPIGIGAAVLVALVAFDRVRIWNAENRGAEKVIAQVERNNASVSHKADAAGRKSLDQNAPGARNPYYRD